MTTTTARQPLRACWAGLLLAAVLALVLPAGTASASGLPAAQTRVGAIHPAVVHIVGVAEHIAAGQRRSRAPSQLRLVSGHCVAAEAGDDALVVRGGTNTADRFSGGSGVTIDDAGNVHGVSVNSAPGRSLEDLTQGIPNKQVGVTTVGDIKAAGGYVKPDPTPGNPFHCLIGGCSPEQFSNLFTPTIKNPWLG